VPRTRRDHILQRPLEPLQLREPLPDGPHLLPGDRLYAVAGRRVIGAQVQHLLDLVEREAEPLRVLDEPQPAGGLRGVLAVAGRGACGRRDQAPALVVADRGRRHAGKGRHFSNLHGGFSHVAKINLEPCFNVKDIATQQPEGKGERRTGDCIYGERGDSIVYLHGGPGGTIDQQFANVEPLADSHVWIGFDQRGSGLSTVPDSLSITTLRHVAHLEELRRHFGIRQMTLFGHSWGAVLAALYASTHRDAVKRLILNGPAPPANALWAQRGAAFQARTTERCRTRLGAVADSTSMSRCRARTRREVHVYYANTLNTRRNRGDLSIEAGTDPRYSLVAQRNTVATLGECDLRRLLPRIRVPALVVEGALTPVPLDEVRLWAMKLADARLILIGRTGHAYRYAENADEFFPAIRAFLRGGWPAGAVVVQRQR
jgi:proline iminopeptidase